MHDIYNTVIFTDIVRRNEIRKVDQLERIVKYTFSNVGNTFSASAIAKYLKSERRSLDEETVYAYLELRRRGYSVHVGKTPGGEIDFVASRQNEKLYVQVTERIVEEATQRREFDRLLEIRDNYPKYILRTNAFADGNHEGIRVMHVADFLLSGGY